MSEENTTDTQLAPGDAVTPTTRRPDKGEPGGDPSLGRPPAPRPRKSPSWSKRRWQRLALGAVAYAILATLALAAFGWWQFANARALVVANGKIERTSGLPILESVLRANHCLPAKERLPDYRARVAAARAKTGSEPPPGCDPEWILEVIMLAIHAADRRNLDIRAVVRVIRVESNFDRSAVSQKIALSLMQCDPIAWADEMVRRKVIARAMDLLTDPRAAVECGTEVLAHYKRLARGDYARALRAYFNGDAELYHPGTPVALAYAAKTVPQGFPL